MHDGPGAVAVVERLPISGEDVDDDGFAGAKWPVAVLVAVGALRPTSDDAAGVGVVPSEEEDVDGVSHPFGGQDRTVMLQHAVGIESIIYHSPMIFEKAGVESKRHAMIGTVCMGVIKLAFETYALLNVDRIGRRPLLLVGSAGLTATLVVLGTALRAKVASGVPGVTTLLLYET